MTEGQIRYQQLAETQRHNLEMERLGAEENVIKSTQAKASVMQAEASQAQAKTREKELGLSTTKHWWDVGFQFASFIFPDANTALKSGAQVVSSLFG